MPIGTDFTITAAGDIRADSPAGTHTVLALHRWLQDLADNASTAGGADDVPSPCGSEDRAMNGWGGLRAARQSLAGFDEPWQTAELAPTCVDVDASLAMPLELLRVRASASVTSRPCLHRRPIASASVILRRFGRGGVMPGSAVPFMEAATAQPTRQSSQWLSLPSARSFHSSTVRPRPSVFTRYSAVR